MDIVELYRSGLTIKEVAAIAGCSVGKVYNTVSSAGIVRSNAIPVNHNFFQTVDSEKKAYWLGFIAADGNVHGNQLKITLAEKDYDHLDKFKCALGSQHSIGIDRTNNAVRIQIRSNELVGQLARFGVVPNKTYTVRFPSLPSELLRHWMRGYFDGDGCITFFEQRPFLSVAGNTELLSAWRDYWFDAGIANRNKVAPRNKYGFAVLQYGGRKQSGRILDWLYTDATWYLNRKHERAMRVIGDKN